jgi:septin 1 family protein
MKDTRVHLLLYFFGGHHVNDSDFIMLKRLQKYANVIPIIPKADSFKPDELLEMKRDVLNNAFYRNVQFFDCVEAITAIVGDVSFQAL